MLLLSEINLTPETSPGTTGEQKLERQLLRQFTKIGLTLGLGSPVQMGKLPREALPDLLQLAQRFSHESSKFSMLAPVLLSVCIFADTVGSGVSQKSSKPLVGFLLLSRQVAHNFHYIGDGCPNELIGFGLLNLQTVNSFSIGLHQSFNTV